MKDFQGMYENFGIDVKKMGPYIGPKEEGKCIKKCTLLKKTHISYENKTVLNVK